MTYDYEYFKKAIYDLTVFVGKYERLIESDAQAETAELMEKHVE